MGFSRPPFRQEERLQSTGSVVVTRLSCPEACGIFPDQGPNPASPASAGGFPTTEPPGKPPEMQFLKSQINYFLICSLVHYFLVDTFGPQIPRAAGRAGARMAGGPGGATWERQPERSGIQSSPPSSAYLAARPAHRPGEFPDAGREQWEEMQEEAATPPLPAAACSLDCLLFPPFNVFLGHKIPPPPRPA